MLRQSLLLSRPVRHHLPCSQLGCLPICHFACLQEWLVQLAGLLFQPGAGLFSQGAADLALQHPSATAALQPDWQKYSRLAGRVVGE
jgi:hypothetical protein